jgi:L-amino acid N-acyltransferase YncA
MEIVIRQARAEDAEAIAGVHIDSWRSAYRGKIPDQILNTLDIEERAQQWKEWLEVPGLSALVATVDGLVAGFCCVMRSRDDDAGDTVAEIPTIYVLPSHWRHGIGRLLCDRTLTEARKRGFTEAHPLGSGLQPSRAAFLRVAGLSNGRKNKDGYPAV